jgi:hypothetical protein
MAKITKEPIAYLPKSDWEIEPWTREMYIKNERELEQIHREYQSIRHLNPSPIRSRWEWLERKGAVRLNPGNEIVAVYDKFNLYARMFDVYSSWLCFKERTALDPDQRKEEIRKILGELAQSLKNSKFGIPQDLRDRAQSDLEYDQDKINF